MPDNTHADNTHIDTGTDTDRKGSNTVTAMTTTASRSPVGNRSGR
ncbi:hypothetical protein QF026_000814 [Streptomyces aurantiacus]|nr:hypothetical protein [Streptomyces aurantiacus]